MAEHQDELDAARRILEHAEHDPEISEEDLLVLKEIIRVYRGLSAFGFLTKWIIGALVALAATATAWEVVTEKARAWFGAP